MPGDPPPPRMCSVDPIAKPSQRPKDVGGYVSILSSTTTHAQEPLP